MSQHSKLDVQMDYWNVVGPTKIFAHPVDVTELRRWRSPTDRILDFGCGYGRALGILHDAGFSNLIGVDPAPAMISRARASLPSIQFETIADFPHVDLPDATVDAVLLFAVLTCVVTNEGQRALISEIKRLLRPNGMLYISDMFLQTDSRNVARYIAEEKRHGIYGVFDLPEGATFRHHDPDWIKELTSDFELLELKDVSVETMNFHPATAFQWFGRKNPHQQEPS